MTPPAPISVLVVGAGSIGCRHLRNLRALGVASLAACDPDAGRLQALAAEIPAQSFTALEAALATFRPDAVFVATPPSLHITQARAAIAAGAHVFLEKPISHTREGISELAAEAMAADRIVQVGYNLRFHPGVRKLKELLDSGTLGALNYVQVEAAQYLPDWRPAQDYRHGYTTRRELGGGMLLDGSHELDYILWLLGPPLEVTCMMGKVSALEVNVEDTVDLLLRYASPGSTEPGRSDTRSSSRSGTHCHVHLDFAQRGYWRSCRLSGQQAIATWDFRANEVRLFDAAANTWASHPYEFAVNDMYLAETQHFLDCLRTGEQPLVGISDGDLVLRLCEAAVDSSVSGRRVNFG